MWRIERNLLIPAVSVLLMTGLLVPAGAAPPKTPVWTLTQQFDGTGKVVTLKLVVPTEPKAPIGWFHVYIDIGQCALSVCTSAYTNCTYPYPCPFELDTIAGGEPQTQSGPPGSGWTATAQQGKSGLTVTIVLTDGFFTGDRQFLDVEYVGIPAAGDVYITGHSKIEQAFE